MGRFVVLLCRCLFLNAKLTSSLSAYEEGPGEEGEPHSLGGFESSEWGNEASKAILDDAGPSWSEVYIGCLPTWWGQPTFRIFYINPALPV